jgi:hypothetical protein
MPNEYQRMTVAGKTKLVFQKRGLLYTRDGYDIEVNEFETFSKKCNMFGKSKTDILRMLIKTFNNSCGCAENVKTAGVLYDQRPGEHIRETVAVIKRELFPWTQDRTR